MSLSKLLTAGVGLAVSVGCYLLRRADKAKWLHTAAEAKTNNIIISDPSLFGRKRERFVAAGKVSSVCFVCLSAAWFMLRRWCTERVLSCDVLC